MNRRQALRMLGTAVASLSWTPEQALQAAQRAASALEGAASAGSELTPEFFTLHELKTVRVLVDMIIPADERSGSATDAGVPEFMDFIMIDQPSAQVAMRGGLAWLDAEALERVDRRFVDASVSEREAILDDIAWPNRAPELLSHGVAFFNRFRDLTATGFWSSRMGVEDLQYIGNRFVGRWRGCPEEQLRKLGLLA